MRVKKTSWRKRILAVILAISMLITMTPATLAEDGLNQSLSVDSEIFEEDTGNAVETVGSENIAADNGNTDVFIDDTEDSGDDAQNGNDTSVEEVISDTDTDTVLETEAETTGDNSAESETEAETDAEDLMEDESEIELCLNLLTEGDASNTQPSLTLAKAMKMEGSNGAVITQAADKLTIIGFTGLILLSNVYPDEYQNLNIYLTDTEGSYNLIQTQNFTYTETSAEGNNTSSETYTFAFLGLGGTDDAYAGALSYAEGSNVSILTRRSFFNSISTDATLEDISFQFTNDVNSVSVPLLADTVQKGSGSKPLECNISLTVPTSGSTVDSAAIGGIIGTLQEGAEAEVVLNNDLTGTLTVLGVDHRGLFCNTMESNSSLTASLTNSGNAQIEVEATTGNGDAGGYVGHMETGGNLVVSGSAVDTVKSDNGNAGGLVGSATSVTIQVDSDATFSLSNVNVTAGSDKSAGGLVGDYTNNKTEEQGLTLSEFYGNDIDITFSGGSNAGGVFGIFKNGGTYTICEGSVTSTLTAGTTYGGLIGKYEAQINEDIPARNATLNISSITSVISYGGSNATSSYGGVIGMLSSSSYVTIDNVNVFTAAMPTGAATCFGGLVGQMTDGPMLNVGNVVLNSNSNDIASDNIGGRGGLVGYIEKGVLRLHGTTDLSNQIITKAYHHTGQIVGSNGSGLVYAVGDGRGNYGGIASKDAWTLIRYSGTGRSGSDIGNWGEVVRLDGSTLKENTDTGALLNFDKTKHTVTVQGVTVTPETDSTTGAIIDKVTLATSCDFAAYALAFNLNSSTDYPTNEQGISTLIFNGTVNWEKQQSVALNGDINLTDTGILGIGKYENSKTDNKYKWYQFQGTFDGNNKTITLDIGSKYGKNIDKNSGNGSGQVYAKRCDSRDAHFSMALFPYGKNITVKNLTVAGNIACVIGNSNQVENDNAKYPVFAAAVVGQAEGDTTFNNVTVNANVSVDDISGKKIYVTQGGIVGQYTSDTSGTGGGLNFINCKWEDSTLTNNRTTDNNRIGGFIGTVFGGGTSVTVSGCTLGGKIETSMTGNAAVGGLIAESRKDYIRSDWNFQESNNNNKISISNLTVSGANIEATAATGTCGGMLGYKWNKTDVTFGGIASEGSAATGVTISGCALNAGSAIFGGLVYQATGYWNVTAANSIKFIDSTKSNTFNGKSNSDSSSGLLVGTGIDNSDSKNIKALYLEVGTWGSNGAAYYIEPDSVTLMLGGSAATSGNYFDELVGKTINTDKDGNAGHDNAVVSLAVRDNDGEATAIDNTTCNTYTGQLGTDKNFKNGKTRYYYNLDSYRTSGTEGATPAADSLDSPAKILSWSVSQYAAGNVRDYFCAGNAAKITGTIDLTGYSYYPVTPLSSVEVKGATLTFAYDTIETAEEDNKQPSDVEHQHHLMHYGLLYNTGSNVEVDDTTFEGTVGRQSTNTANTTFNSGALIFGSVTGDPTQNPVEVTLTNVILAGLRVSGVEENTIIYAPLLINQITQAAKLNVNGLSTGEGYTADKYAATSLIGNVGGSNATKLTLTFSNIALDARKSASIDNATSVKNNGTVEVEYNTTHTIFTGATLLESFQYKSEGSGTYNFNSTDAKVTYGVELSNSGTIGRNPDNQHQYYDNDKYVTDEEGKTDADADYVKGRYTDDNFIRYVHVLQNVSENKYELDINQKTTGLLEGCGTYGDPYIIKDSSQMISLANYINDDTRSNTIGFEVVFNSKVLRDQKQTSTSYHTCGNATTEDTGTDIVYTWGGSNWKNTNDETADATIALQYLQNAYYQIQGEITLPADKFAGLGTLANPFSGVIVSENNNTVSIIGTNEEKTNFSGLVRYSRGSVVKNLTVDYTGAEITMSNDDVPSSTNNPFFGGVVGYCMGGDTIIDNVSVSYGTDSVKLEGAKARLIATGGYVGLVGGAKSVTDTTEYEKTGGGVVFRKMEEKSDPFKGDMAANSDAGSTYFYCNPFVGRVLDGYACYEGGTKGNSTINNTDKNYTIPDVPTTGGLTVTQASDGSLTATVTSAQGLWLLSAIVNSGAGAMDSTGTYLDYENGNYVEAYQYGKPRTGKYDLIGKDGGETDLADEAYWGGINSTANTDQAKARVSFLVKKCGSNAAAQLTGRSTTATKSVNNPVLLKFDAAEIDMTPYKNGFRGIGGSYGEKKSGKETYQNLAYRRSLRVSGVSGKDTGTTIRLAMDQHDYEEEYESKIWSNQGAGLFTVFMYMAGGTGNPCLVQKLTISGTVSVRTYSVGNGIECGIKKVDYDMGVGGFASRPGNSKDQALKFNDFHLDGLNVAGGTATGGTIGLVACSGPMEFNDWSIKDSTVYKWVYNDGSTGGLTGWYASGKGLTINGYRNDTTTPDKQNVDNLTVTVKADTKLYGNIGGLTGANDETGSTVTIQNVNVTGLKVYGIKAREIGGLTDGGAPATTITNCTLKDIIVVDNGSSGPVGGVIGRNKGNAIIEGVTINGNSMISGNSDYSGGMIGKPESSVTLNDCHIIGTSSVPIMVTSELSLAGGFLGFPNNTNTIRNCTAEYLQVKSSSSDAGGLVGKMGNGSTSVSNVAFSNVSVTSKNKDSKSAGLLIGDTNGKPINGYNILADTCTIKADTANTPQKRAGIWMGYCSTDSKLVAVAVKGSNQPQKDIGTILSGKTVQITYADYPVNQSYNPDGTTSTPKSASPWLDVNPKSNVTLRDGTVMTGNGVGYIMNTNTIENEEGTNTITETKGDSVAKAILTEAKNGGDNRIYCNLPTGENTDISKFLDSDNDVYLTFYQTEEEGNTTVPTGIDFPILVVNNLADADTQIWNYIAALTNVSTGEAAKGQADSVIPVTYQWTGDSNEEEAEGGTVAGSFVNLPDASLSVSDKTISITRDAYDNQNSQFTLLTVRYSNPTYTEGDSNSNPQYFNLYVPVLVKKVLYTSFRASFLAGTDYLAADYPVPVSSKKNYATAGFDEPVTAYIEYNYDRKAEDWNKMLASGDNLQWYYDKVLELAYGKTLPEGTRLTLVDRQTGQYYTHTLDSSDKVHEFNLSTMLDSDGNPFAPVCVSDLLGLKATKDTNGTYVKVTEGGTIIVEGEQYRIAIEEDEGDRYTISVDSSLIDSSSGTNYLRKGEGYYLTIQVPKTDDLSVVNNPLRFYSNVLSGSTASAPLAYIKTVQVGMGEGATYVIYDGVQQSDFTVRTCRVRNGSEYNDTKMEDGDSIKVTLTSTLKLNDAAKQSFYDYTPSKVNHRFNLNMKKYLEGDVADTVIGAVGASYTYTITGAGASNPIDTVTQTLSGSEILNELSMECSSGAAADMAQYLKNNYNKDGTLTITAEITLPYPTLGTYFPARSKSDSIDGIFASAVSRVANESSQLPITSNKRTADSSNHYYTENPSNASLNYYTINGGADEDITQQLGINPSDLVNNSDNVIYTQADYDYSGVDAAALADAVYIRYSMELFQKDDDGNYNNKLLIGNYLQGVNINHQAITDPSLYQIYDFTPDNNAKQQFVNIHFTPLTGTEFETARFTYANYQVKLTAVLLDADEKSIEGTEASDYIIYTNARIYQQMITPDTNTTS